MSPDLTLGQIKGLVMAYVFGPKEVNSTAYASLLQKGLIVRVKKDQDYEDKLSQEAEELAKKIIEEKRIDIRLLHGK